MVEIKWIRNSTLSIKNSRSTVQDLGWGNRFQQQPGLVRPLAGTNSGTALRGIRTSGVEGRESRVRGVGCGLMAERRGCGVEGVGSRVWGVADRFRSRLVPPLGMTKLPPPGEREGCLLTIYWSEST